MPRIQALTLPEFRDSVEPAWLIDVAETALSTHPGSERDAASIVIADDASVAALNAEHRGLAETTDVLSFSNVHSGGYYGDDERERGEFDFVLPPGHVADLGEIIVSLPQARRQATERRHTLRNELAALLAHGLFHLLGYDHEEEGDAELMRRREGAAMRALRRRGLID